MYASYIYNRVKSYEYVCMYSYDSIHVWGGFG